MSRVVTRRGLPPAAASRAFRFADLVAAAATAATDTVYVEHDGEGGMSGGAAEWARAALPPHVAAPAALLEPASPRNRYDRDRGVTVDPGGGWVRAVVPTGAGAGAVLSLWPGAALAAAAALPFLTLRNIVPRAPDNKQYICHECGERFEQPNPLKVHLYLSCGAPAPAAFWARLLDRLATAPPPEPPLPLPLPELPALSPLTSISSRELEALATAWGGSRGGHLCLYCGKLYSRKYGLKIHIRTHTGYKPLRCRHCARAFGDPSNLNKHVRLHRPREAPS